MKTELGHTPLPWNCSYGYIASQSDGYLPLVTPFVHTANKDKHGNATKEANANAEYIVKACNAYPELVAALRDLAEFADSAKEDSRSVGSNMIDIRDTCTKLLASLGEDGR